MKIFDCFMYFDEETVLELRLNILNKYVDYFIIVESSFTHKGEKRDLKFNHQKFTKFKDKIIYITYDEEPPEIAKNQVSDKDSEAVKSWKYISNALYRENGQRNYISKGLNLANNDDIILISDVDEIPNLENLDSSKIREKIILFNQDMFYYKFNLKLPNLDWTGTKGCRKKFLKSPQWLRNIKDRKYSFYRLDTFFSDTKYIDIKIISDGGWHFSNLKTASEIEFKLKSYLHHREFDINPLSEKEINSLIENKQAIYDLKVDKKIQKMGHGNKLEKYELEKLPSYLNNNLEKFKNWLD